MKRLPDWYDRLKETVERFDGLPFVWGGTDCAVFAAACVEAMTGQDLLGTYRGTYTSRLTADGRLRGRGFRTLRQAVEKALTDAGAVQIDPRFAQCGDIGITRADVIVVRMPCGFIARKDGGDFAVSKPVVAWAIGWA